MKKVMTRDAFFERLETISGDMQSDVFTDFENRWNGRGINLYGRMTKEQWEFVMKELVPLMGAAAVHGRPPKFGPGSRGVWSMIDSDALENRFGERDIGNLVDAFRQLLDEEWLNEQRERPTFVKMAEEYVNGWSRYHQLAAAMDEYGFESIRTALADHGMTDQEINGVSAVLKALEKEIDAANAPEPVKAPLVPPPASGDWPLLDDEAYLQYLKDVKSKYESGVDALTAWGGIPYTPEGAMRVMENLHGFDHAAILATLGAQKRWPPEGHWGIDELYEKLAKLPDLVANNFEEHSADKFKRYIDDAIQALDGGDDEIFSDLSTMHRYVFRLKELLPGMESAAFAGIQERLAREFEPRWASMAGGPMHNQLIGKIVFTTSRTLPQTADDIPETINPVKEPVYAHIFLGGPFSGINTGMIFFKAGDEQLILQVADLPEPAAAYTCMNLLPEKAVGRNPELIGFFGMALESANDAIECTISPAAEIIAAGRLVLGMSKADRGKLATHIQTLKAAAEENRTREAVLPEVFTKPFKGYKDKTLALDKLIEAIEEAWERNSGGEKITIRAVRVNHYKGPGKEWREEFNPFEEPVQRLTDSYVGIVYDTSDGRTCCVEDGIQFRQFYTRGKGYVADLDVLFWGLKSFALPSDQVKRIKD